MNKHNTVYVSRTLMGLLLLVFIFMSGCATTSVRQHPEFATKFEQYKVVAILPPNVEIEQINFTGENERLYEEEERLGKEVVDEIMVELEMHGYTPKIIDLSELSADEVNEINFEIEKIRTAYSEISKELYATPGMDAAKAHQMNKSIGPMVNFLSDKTGSDALLITSLSGFKKSTGQRTKEIIGATLLALATGFVPVSPGEGAGLEFAMIDGTTGNVLWTNIRGGSLDPRLIVRTTINGLQPHTSSAVASGAAEEIRSKRDFPNLVLTDDSDDTQDVEFQ